MPSCVLFPLLCFLVYYLSLFLFMYVSGFFFEVLFRVLSKGFGNGEGTKGNEGNDFHRVDCATDSHSDFTVSINVFMETPKR